MRQRLRAIAPSSRIAASLSFRSHLAMTSRRGCHGSLAIRASPETYFVGQQVFAPPWLVKAHHHRVALPAAGPRRSGSVPRSDQCERCARGPSNIVRMSPATSSLGCAPSSQTISVLVGERMRTASQDSMHARRGAMLGQALAIGLVLFGSSLIVGCGHPWCGGPAPAPVMAPPPPPPRPPAGNSAPRRPQGASRSLGWRRLAWSRLPSPLFMHPICASRQGRRSSLARVLVISGGEADRESGAGLQILDRRRSLTVSMIR